MKESSPRLSTSSTTDETATSSAASSNSCQINRLPLFGYEPRSSNQSNKDFKSSRAPSRILFFRNDTWVDFPCQVFDELTSGFMAGNPVLELSINGNSFIFDFLRMIQINLSTKAENSIAWIDVDGRCFFPTMVFQEQGSEPRFPGAERISRDEDKFYNVVEKLFLDGMRRFVPNTIVTGVHKCFHLGSSSGSLRLRAFQMMMGMKKAERGDANVKFGWYGSSAEGVAGVVKHGFGRSNDGVLGVEAHGVGVHLSPPHFPSASSLLSEADEGEEKHIVLCRVIMGNSERVETGSTQYHPSSDEFDSGVDDLMNPKWYIVWSTHMNTHILPEYIVSFKSSTQHQGSRTPANSTRRPYIASELSFQKLLSEIGRSLPSSSMQTLEILYNKHKAGKMSKDALIRYLRSVAGDKLLASTIKRIRGY